jgi:low affinity Fe/Cu permease
MKIETPIIALCLAAVVFTGMFLMVFQGADENNVSYDLSEHTTHNGTTINNAFSVINESKSEMDDIIQDFEDTTVSDSGSLFNFISLTFSIGKQFLGATTLFKNMAVVAGEFLGVPAWVVGALVSILIIIIIVSIVLLIAGRSQ